MINVVLKKFGDKYMDEFSFIDSIKQHSYKQSSLLKGIGDDAAVFRQPAQDIVTAVDTFVEDVHFSRKTMEPYHVGYRGLAANISDLAAMGASPTFYLVSIVIPKTWSMKDVDQIFHGMREIAAVYQMDLIGGDTVFGKELAVSITVIGYTERNKARYRSSARNGDIVFVTGTLGDSQAGMHILLNENKYENKDYYIKKHQKPLPRVDFAKALADLPRVALNDVSDGIANEASEIAVASGVSIHLYDEQLPISQSYQQFPLDLQRKWKLFGGEDFELLGTVAKESWLDVKEAAEKSQTPITKIGYVHYSVDEVGYVFLHDNKDRQLLQKDGYIHKK